MVHNHHANFQIISQIYTDYCIIDWAVFELKLGKWSICSRAAIFYENLSMLILSAYGTLSSCQI